MAKETIDQLVYYQTYQKLLGNILNHQMSSHFKSIILKQQTGFCRDFNTQHCLLVMLEKIRKALDKGRDYAALFTDLSKAFDCS